MYVLEGDVSSYHTLYPGGVYPNGSPPSQGLGLSRTPSLRETARNCLDVVSKLLETSPAKASVGAHQWNLIKFNLLQSNADEYTLR
jgi:hypothetical protein